MPDLTPSQMALVTGICGAIITELVRAVLNRARGAREERDELRKERDLAKEDLVREHDLRRMYEEEADKYRERYKKVQAALDEADDSQAYSRDLAKKWREKMREHSEALRAKEEIISELRQELRRYRADPVD